MPEQSAGYAAAGDAQTISSEDVASLDDVLDPEVEAKRLRQQAIDEADAAVEAAETKVKRQQEHLDGAKQGLAEAREARKGI